MGVFQADLYADYNLKPNVKYRNSPYVRGVVKATRIAVSNGNFSNKDLWADNSVELGVSWVVAQESNYIVITHSITDPDDPNNIIPWTKIAGEIYSTEYVNNTNVNISFTVDHYTSAQLTKELRSDFFIEAVGLCARTNVTYPSESCANQLAEPFSGGDMKTVDGYMSYNMASEICNTWGLSMSNGIIENGFCLILWISNFAATTVARCGGTITPWVANGCSAPPANTVVTSNANFIQPNLESSYQWYGSYSSGYPTVWTSITALNTFVNGILNTIGQEKTLQPWGLGSQSSITKWAVINDSYYTSMGNTYYDQTEQMKQTKIVTSDDIFNIQIVPLKVATAYQAQQKIEEHNFQTKWNLSNFNPMQDERGTIAPYDFSKSKLMAYPYWYFKCITNIGNEIEIIPQTKLLPYSLAEENYLYDFNIYYLTRFIGGNNPRLMIAIPDSTNIYGSIVNGSGNEWHTIWEFPSIPWQHGVSSEAQLQELSANLNRTSQIYSSIVGQSIKGTGFSYGYRSGNRNDGNGAEFNAQNQGGLRSLISKSGAGWGILADVTGLRGTFGRTYKDDAQVSKDNLSASASNVVASNPHVIVGEGAIGSLLSPPVKVLRCGCTDGELFAFARYLDRQGQAVNCIINPITNAGSVFGGHGSISSYNGKTYYQFHDIDIVGDMPVLFKTMIQSLFIGGVYLVN